MPSSFVLSFMKKLYSRPYLIFTNTATGIVSVSIGDVLQQNLEYLWTRKMEHHSDQVILSNSKLSEQMVWDIQRTKYMMSAGIYFSLFGHWWYTWLDRRFPPRTKFAVQKKLIAEMFMGPPLVSSVFFVCGTLKGQSLAKTWEYLKSNLVLIALAEWCIFIPVQWFNFAFVPAQFRYLYVATVSICYDAFLSFILHRNERYQTSVSMEKKEV